MEPRSANDRNSPDILADARFRRAFAELLTGIAYAEMTSSDYWDFAVEIHMLRRFGLSNNDLRLLVRRHIVEHAKEVKSDFAKGRRFQRMSTLVFAKQSCFVLTRQGIAEASDHNQEPIPAAAAEVIQIKCRPRTEGSGVTPAWNAQRRELSYGGQTIRQFLRRAVNQELILSAFEEENWPPRIDDPLVPRPSQDAKGRLHDTIKCLNRGMGVQLMCFRGDGTGRGVVWEALG